MQNRHTLGRSLASGAVASNPGRIAALGSHATIAKATHKAPTKEEKAVAAPANPNADVDPNILSTREHHQKIAKYLAQKSKPSAIPDSSIKNMSSATQKNIAFMQNAYPNELDAGEGLQGAESFWLWSQPERDSKSYKQYEPEGLKDLKGAKPWKMR